MKTKKYVIFICNNIAPHKAFLPGTTKMLGFKFKHFPYPESFEEWIEKKPKVLDNIKLILLGQSFPGDGSKQRESGPSRGVLFYQRLLENNTLNKVKLIILAEIGNQKEYFNICKKYNITLRDSDMPVDILDYYQVCREELEKLKK